MSRQHQCRLYTWQSRYLNVSSQTCTSAGTASSCIWPTVTVDDQYKSKNLGKSGKKKTL